jgi:hypothetical protein
LLLLRGARASQEAAKLIDLDQPITAFIDFLEQAFRRLFRRLFPAHLRIET